MMQIINVSLMNVRKQEAKNALSYSQSRPQDCCTSFEMHSH